MASRLQLQSKLEELLTLKNVYYQPPATIRMNYPAIRYALSVPDSRFANNKRYAIMRCYNLIVISMTPDPEVVDKILELPYSSPGRSYVSDNLYHYPITIYY